MVMVKIMLLLLLLVTRHHSWMWSQILVCKQFFQGSDHIRGWKWLMGCDWWRWRLWRSWTIMGIWCAKHQKLHEPKINYILIYLLPYLLTPWCRVLLDKLIGSQLVKKFPAYHGTWRFITAFTHACQLFLPSDSLIQSMPPYPISWRSILILHTHLCLGLPSGLFPSGFPTKTLNMPLLSPINKLYNHQYISNSKLMPLIAHL